MHGVSVGSAGEHDTKAAVPIIEAMQGYFPRLKKIMADRGFSGDELRRLVTLKLKAFLDTTPPPEKTPEMKGFQSLLLN